MHRLIRTGLLLVLTASLSGCIFYDHPHRHWYPPVYGHPGYWR